MNYLVSLILMIPLFSCDTKKPLVATGTIDHIASALPGEIQDNRIAQAFVSAIAVYITRAFNENFPAPDTLFIRKHADFPDIALPGIIENVNVKLVSHEELLPGLKFHQPLVSLNVIGWVDEATSEFIIVTFFDNAIPQHNCHIYFTAVHENFQLDSLSFDYPYVVHDLNAKQVQP